MKLLKQLSIYTLVGVIGAGISFFVMPVLSHYLSPADYGMLSLFNTYITILIPFVSISAYAILNVDYYKKKDVSAFASQFTSIQAIPVLTTAILSILVWSSYDYFAGDLELKGTGRQWGFIILAITFLSIYFEQLTQLLILQKKANLYAAVTLVKVFLEVGLTFYFVMAKGMGWEGRMYAWLIVSIAFFLVAVFYFRREAWLVTSFKWHFAREAVIFGAPLVLHNIGKFVVNQSDRLFIVKMVSLEEAGIYNIGYTVGMLVMIVINAFFNYYTPFLMERLSDLTDIRRLQIVKLSYMYLVGSVLMLGGLILFTPLFFKYLIDPQYASGARYVFWVALGYCFWGGYMLFSGFIFFYKRNRILGWLSIFNVVVNLVLNYFFISAFGGIGAAYATAVSFLLLFIIVAWIGNRMVPLPWGDFKALKNVPLTD